MSLLTVSANKEITWSIIQNLKFNLKTIVDTIKQGVYKIMSYFYTIIQYTLI